MKNILEGLPWQIKAIFVVGFPSVIALLLVGHLIARDAGWIGSKQPDSPGNNPLLVEKHLKIEDEQLRMLNVVNDKFDQTIAKLTVGLRVLCQNSSKTVQERNNCENIR